MLLSPYRFTQMTIVEIIRESKEAVSLRLAAPTDYTFVSGQYAVVQATIDGIVFTRQYSFSSAPSSGEIWLTVVKTQGGIVSSWIVDKAKAGDSLDISQAFTGSLVHKDLRGNICMIAGGSGISPLMSYLRELRLRSSPPPITLRYSTRTAARCFKKELLPVADGNEDVAIALSDTSGRFTHQAIMEASKDADVILLCGSHAFVTAMHALCKQSNQSAAILRESFTL